MQKNHIGQAFEFIKSIADDCGWNYSHGTLTESPQKNAVVYPLIHANVQSISVSDRTASITLNVGIMDRVSFLKTEDQGLNPEVIYSEMGYTENQNYAHILQELYVKFLIALDRAQYTDYHEIQAMKPINFTPFIETENSVLAGHVIILTLIVDNPFVTDGRCEIP